YEAHVEIGAALLAPVLSAEQISWVRAHREHWDGSGYPGGLSGDEIPEGARIMAVALAFASATAPPPAGRGLDVESAVAALAAEAEAGLWPPAVEELAHSVLAIGPAPEGAGPMADDL
ncbi:MAG: HD-GYP domain-containing protein, partial [Miltoncostaeaceae bacterium]